MLGDYEIPVSWARVATLALCITGIVAVNALSPLHGWGSTIPTVATAVLSVVIGVVIQPRAKPENYSNQAAASIASAYEASEAVTNAIGRISRVRVTLPGTEADLALAGVQEELVRANTTLGGAVAPWDEIEPEAVRLAIKKKSVGLAILEAMSKEYRDDHQRA